MNPNASRPNPPNDDRRWKIVAATIRRNGGDGHALIETLHTVQEVFGFLDEPALDFVAKSLRVPLSRAYGVATFYHYFSMKPSGKHTCVVCTGTACHIKGAGALVEKLEETFHVRLGETTTDGELSVMSARCIGSCGLAPAVVLDGRVLGGQEPNKLVNRMREVLG